MLTHDDQAEGRCPVIRKRPWLLILMAGLLLLPGGMPRGEEADANYRDLMKEGIRLHDAGDHDGALEIYRRLLKSHPDDGSLLYEMALTTSAKGDYRESIALAEKALKKGAGDPAACYSLIGTDYDLLEEYGKGEKTFRQGIKRFPDSGILHFNLGVNLAKQGKNDEAIQELQEDIRLRPDHPGGWYSLATLAEAQDQKVRAFLAYVRFLTLQPESSRSKEAAGKLWPLMFTGVEKGAAPTEDGKTQINITLPPPGPGKAADRRSAESVAMTMVAANRWVEEWEGRTDSQFFAHGLETLTQIFSEYDQNAGDRDPFWGLYADDYFKDARERGHMEAMAYDIRRSLGIPEDAKWLEEHSGAVAAYRAWSKGWKPPAAE